MATYREFIYMVLDMMKLAHDDAYFTEGHALFVLKKMRAMLLERKYGSGRAARAAGEVPEADLQEICLDLELSEGTDGVCGTGAGRWLRSVQEVPRLMYIGAPAVYPLNPMLGERYSLVPIQRLPFVGGSRWLSRFIYAALGPDGHLYVAGGGTGWRHLKRLKLSGVFDDPEEADALSCDGAGCGGLDREFPLEAPLQASLVELAVQELTGARLAFEDRSNDAMDALGRGGGSSQPPSAATAQDAQARGGAVA